MVSPNHEPRVKQMLLRYSNSLKMGKKKLFIYFFIFIFIFLIFKPNPTRACKHLSTTVYHSTCQYYA